MGKSPKAWILAISLLLVLICFAWIASRPRGLEAELGAHGYTLDLPSRLKEFERVRVELDGRETITLIARTENEKAEFEIVTPVGKEEAQEIIETRFRLIDLQYEDKLSPYPGAITNLMNCPENLRPRSKAGQGAGILLAEKMDAKGSFRDCDESHMSHQAVIEYSYDEKSQKLTQLFLLMKKEDPDFGKLLRQLRHFALLPDGPSS